MTNSAQDFADLLTMAVRKIKAIEGKNLEVIQDELGFALGREGASYINYLRRPNLPSSQVELEALTRALFNRRGLEATEVERFLRLGKHTETQTAAQTIIDIRPGAGGRSVPHTPGFHNASGPQGFEGPSWSRLGAGSSGHASGISSTAPALERCEGSFVTGPPITNPCQFFGRERELRRIFAWWRQAPMSHVALVGPKRCGKTSLLHYLARIHVTPPGDLRAGQKQDWLTSAKDYRWVWVDFRDARMRKLDSLLRHILSDLGLRVPDASEPCDLDTFMDITATPQRWQRPTIIVMDNIDAGLSAPDLGQALWDSLRALVSFATEGNLAFIVSAHEDPVRLAIQNTQTSHFFNIFNTVQLGPLTEAEARNLITHTTSAMTEEDVTWVLAHSECWPLLVQICCEEWALAREAGQTDDGWRAETLKRIAAYPFRHSQPRSGDGQSNGHG